MCKGQRTTRALTRRQGWQKEPLPSEPPYQLYTLILLFSDLDYGYPGGREVVFTVLLTYISLVTKHTLLSMFSQATWLLVYQIGETIIQIIFLVF